MTLTLILNGLFFCHFLAEFTSLSNKWMHNAKKLGKPFTPIFTHALVHGILMGSYMLLLGIKYETILYMCLFQVITHFIIDVLKGRLNEWFPSLQNNSNQWHWVVFGGDQYLHALVIIQMTLFIISN